jgi:protease I
MSRDLNGKRVAILVAPGFEQSEMLNPREALEEAGAFTELISFGGRDEVRAWDQDDFGDAFPVDRDLSEVRSNDYDALLIPGGVQSPDKLRGQEKAVALVRAFFNEGKPIAAICHGPWLLVEADVVRGRRLTSYPSIKTDLKNAGAIWVDESVVVDEGLITSRKPDDIPAFNQKIIEEFAMGIHVRRT